MSTVEGASAPTLPRYEARKDLGQTEPPFEYLVFDAGAEQGHSPILGPGLTETEAHIAAWALSWVAAGFKLAAQTSTGDVVEFYAGPTDL